MPCSNATPSLQIRFAIWRYESQALVEKIAEKYNEAKQIYRFREIQGWTPAANKNY